MMGTFHVQFPAMEQIVSECSPEILGFSTIELLISSLRDYATTVSVWNVALDPAGGPVQPPDSGCHGCRGIVTVSEADHSVQYNVKYYELGQVSKFVRPGRVRIDPGRAPEYRDVIRPSRFQPSAGVDNVAFGQPRPLKGARRDEHRADHGAVRGHVARGGIPLHAAFSRQRHVHLALA